MQTSAEKGKKIKGASAQTRKTAGALAAKKAATAPSISDQLAGLGYGHRRDANTHNTGQRVIFVKRTGEVVGRFTAHEAVEHFLAR